MTVKLSAEEWAQVRYEYEHTDKPVEDICLDHGISSNTLRDRVRRWGWTRRHAPIPAEGPPPLRPREPAAPLATPPAPAAGLEPVEPFAPDAAPQEGGDAGLPAPPVAVAPGEAPPPDPAETMRRLQSAVARVLPAIEAIVAKLAAGPMHPREMERAGRALSSLTRTLRELQELLSRHQAGGADPCATCGCDLPADPDAFRIELARRIETFVASRTRQEEEAKAQAAAVTESE
jgi:hypothetical protein